MRTVFTTGQAAKICKVAPRTVCKWLDSGRLCGYRIPGSKARAGLPPGGLLTWEGDGVKPSLFQSRGDARDAIDRTHHYAMAFGEAGNWPEKSAMKILECVLTEES